MAVLDRPVGNLQLNTGNTFGSHAKLKCAAVVNTSATNYLTDLTGTARAFVAGTSVVYTAVTAADLGAHSFAWTSASTGDLATTGGLTVVLVGYHQTSGFWPGNLVPFGKASAANGWYIFANGGFGFFGSVVENVAAYGTAGAGTDNNGKICIGLRYAGSAAADGVNVWINGTRGGSNFAAALTSSTDPVVNTVDGARYFHVAAAMVFTSAFTNANMDSITSAPWQAFTTAAGGGGGGDTITYRLLPSGGMKMITGGLVA